MALDVMQSPFSVFTYIGFTYFVYVFLDDRALVAERTKFELGFFHFVFFMVLYCYYYTWKIEAGRVPENFTLESSSKEEVVSNFSPETTFSGNPRFCTKCSRPKPDRAHHCRKCGRCILKMDHHCPWTGSCVGFYNYKYYMLLLFYADVTLSFILVTEFPRVRDAYYFSGKNWLEYCLLSSYFFSSLMFLSTGALGLYHTSMCVQNITTLEFLEKRRSNPGIVRRYNIGPAENWMSVFGPNLCLWLVPTRYGIVGDGLSFPTQDQVKETV